MNNRKKKRAVYARHIRYGLLAQLNEILNKLEAGTPSVN
jgi:hypothetical protein